MFFFFQAEDGIRDLVRSRGLGDVYKRQEETREQAREKGYVETVFGRRLYLPEIRSPNGPRPVSYTHLTLPTSDLV